MIVCILSLFSIKITNIKSFCMRNKYFNRNSIRVAFVKSTFVTDACTRIINFGDLYIGVACTRSICIKDLYAEDI